MALKSPFARWSILTAHTIACAGLVAIAGVMSSARPSAQASLPDLVVQEDVLARQSCATNRSETCAA